MKNTITLLFSFFLLGGIVQGQDTIALDSLRVLPQTAFQVGEELQFILHYGFINAGKATLRIEKGEKKYYGRPTYHIIGEGKTMGATDWFFKVRDKYETHIDQAGIFPWEFNRRVNEGGYKIKQDYYFEHHQGTVKDNKKKAYPLEAGMQDMLSAFYYARTLDFESANFGDTFDIISFVDGERFPMQIKLIGREKVSTKVGKFDCYRFTPMVQEGRVFKGEEDLSVWITADGNHIPVLVEAEVLIGSVRMELSGYKNLRNPISKVH
ncbi:MAG: hypothetical protein ACJAY8_001466 [Sphingobacteriales bacterium]|jgi:hypothetical protein